jgi:hypothetical protein
VICYGSVPIAVAILYNIGRIVRIFGKILNNTLFWSIVCFIGMVQFQTITLLSFSLFLLFLLSFFNLVYGRFIIINTNKKVVPIILTPMYTEEEVIERLCQKYGFANPTIAKYEHSEAETRRSYEAEQQTLFAEIEKEYARSEDERERSYIKELRKNAEGLSDSEDESSCWKEHISQIRTDYRLTTRDIIDSRFRVKEYNGEYQGHQA